MLGVTARADTLPQAIAAAYEAAEKISFTSSKNPSPNSVQIVLRTDEISDDDESTDISDQEADGSSEEGPLKRMWNVLVAIVKAIIEIFQNR